VIARPSSLSWTILKTVWFSVVCLVKGHDYEVIEQGRGQFCRRCMQYHVPGF
jgi:hypothetical protein